MSYKKALLVGAITGAITGAIVLLGGIIWAGSTVSIAENIAFHDAIGSMAMEDTIIFAIIGAAIGFMPGVMGSFLGKRVNEDASAIFLIICGIVLTVFVVGICSFFLVALMLALLFS